MDKKKEQLGMPYGTASGRLVKDILWKMIEDTDNFICLHCHKPMSRETFSIEHIVPWLDSEDPKALFFDLKNITFSHLSCNSGARRTEESQCGTERKYKRGCRCDKCSIFMKDTYSRRYNSEKRKEKYRRLGN